MKIFDGHNAVLGRLATVAAKNLLNGEEVAVVNSERIIITGNPKSIISKYVKMRQIGSPQHGPFFPKRPDAIVHRTIRSMLPYKTNKGRAALKNLRVYVGTPKDFAGKDIDKIATKAVKTDFIRIGEVAKIIGWNE